MYEGQVDNFFEFNKHGEGTLYFKDDGIYSTFRGEFNKYSGVTRGVFTNEDGSETGEVQHLISTLSNLDVDNFKLIKLRHSIS